MPNRAYGSPVNRLLTYTADVDRMRGPWPQYVEELGLTHDDIPELIRMMNDRALWEMDAEGPEIWAAVHAWRALAQLEAVEVIGPLLAMVREDPDNDWAMSELPIVAAKVGPGAVPPLSRVVEDRAAAEDERTVAAEALTQIGLVHEAAREPTIAVLSEQLRYHSENDAVFNGFLVCFLIDLGAKPALPLIEAAYDADDVDETICGDVNDARVAFGEEPRPIPERDRALWELAKAQVMNEMLGNLAPRQGMMAPWEPSTPPLRQSPQAKAKAKAKRKAERQARKKNRR